MARRTLQIVDCENVDKDCLSGEQGELRFSMHDPDDKIVLVETTNVTNKFVVSLEDFKEAIEAIENE